MKRFVLVPAIAAAAVALTTGTAYASMYVAYEGPAYTGNHQIITACGLTNIKYHGSYKWYASGQSGRMYNASNGAGPMHYELSTRHNAEQPTGVGWKSIFIVC